ncbi:MAG: hypothetical protein OEZ06_09075 [Myxococcales bacterium]|nr:hypothetical protein [Myxococcales bacterium]
MLEGVVSGHRTAGTIDGFLSQAGEETRGGVHALTEQLSGREPARNDSDVQALRSDSAS